MQTTTTAIWIFSILDTILVAITLLLNRRWYGHVPKPAFQHIFCNIEFDEPVNHPVLGKSGLLPLAVGCISLIILTQLSHAASI